MQNHVIFGAGLIGCYLGGALRIQGFAVDLICREKTKSNLHNGMKLTDYQQHQADVTGLTFNKTLAQSQAIDVLWLTVKCIDVHSALPQIKTICNDNTIIICCQNGLGSDAQVKQHLPNNHVIKAMVPFNVVEIAPGHFHRGSEGAFTIERLPDMVNWLNELVRSMRCDFLPVECTDDISALLWAKLQLNLGNSINALADIPVKAMLEQRPYRQVIAAMMEELLAVTDEKDIHLPKVTALPSHWIPKVLRLPTWLFKLVANKMLAIDPKVRTSMWWDLSKGKLTEIDHLNGAIVEHALALNIPCSVNQKVIQLVKDRENNQIPVKIRSISASQLYKEVIEH